MSILGPLQRNKAVSIIAALAVVLIIIFLSFVFSSASKNNIVPSSFVDARATASERALEIVGMLSVTNEKIKEVKDFVERGNHAQALTIVRDEIGKNKDIREQAVRLALELGKMAEAIPNIRSDKAAQVALAATTKETAVISQLLSYTNELQNLLVALEMAVVSGRPDYSDVNEAIATINSAAGEINKLNEEYKVEMENFDKIVAGDGGGEISPVPSISSTSSPVSS